MCKVRIRPVFSSIRAILWGTEQKDRLRPGFTRPISHFSSLLASRQATEGQSFHMFVIWIMERSLILVEINRREVNNVSQSFSQIVSLFLRGQDVRFLVPTSSFNDQNNPQSKDRKGKSPESE